MKCLVNVWSYRAFLTDGLTAFLANHPWLLWTFENGHQCCLINRVKRFREVWKGENGACLSSVDIRRPSANTNLPAASPEPRLQQVQYAGFTCEPFISFYPVVLWRLIKITLCNNLAVIHVFLFPFLSCFLFLFERPYIYKHFHSKTMHSANNFVPANFTWLCSCFGTESEQSFPFMFCTLLNISVCEQKISLLLSLKFSIDREELILSHKAHHLHFIF